MPRKHTPPPTFSTWLSQAKPGERLVYHIDGAAKPDDRLWTAAWDAHLEGKVALFQKRDGGRLHYIAQRLSPKAKRLLAGWDRVIRVLNGQTPYQAGFLQSLPRSI